MYFQYGPYLRQPLHVLSICIKWVVLLIETHSVGEAPTEYLYTIQINLSLMVNYLLS